MHSNAIALPIQPLDQLLANPAKDFVPDNKTTLRVVLLLVSFKCIGTHLHILSHFFLLLFG